jgi:hypothetical protein
VLDLTAVDLGTAVLGLVGLEEVVLMMATLGMTVPGTVAPGAMRTVLLMWRIERSELSWRKVWPRLRLRLR